MGLFGKEISVSKDLETLKASADRLGLSRSYAILAFLDSPRVAELRAVLDMWFVETTSFLDREFPNRLKTEFHQRIWELYVGKLLNLKFQLLNKAEIGLPDFKASLTLKDVWFEATAPDNGDRSLGNRLPLLREEITENGFAEFGGLISDRTDPVVLRLKTAISQKWTKYLSTYLRNGVQAEDPFVVAINSYLFDDGLDPEHIILQLFFGMGNQVVFFGNGKGDSDTRIFREQRSVVTSLRGDLVEVGMFQSNQYEAISGVIFAYKDLYNLDASQRMGSDIFFIENPFARNKISIGDFSFCTRVTVEGENVKFEPPQSDSTISS